MFDLLIKNGKILTINSNMDIIEKGYVGIKDGKIAYLGENAPTEDAKETIDAQGKIVMPGFVNTHTHLPMTLLRSYADDMFLQDWLTKMVFPAEAKMDDECARIGSVLGIAEMLKNGIVSFTDMYDHMFTIADTVLETGIKANLGRPIVDFDKDNYKFENSVAYNDLVKLIDKYHMADDGRIKIDGSIHAVYTSHPEAWKDMAEFSKKNNLGLHIHLSETQVENHDAQKLYGKTPTELLNEAGCLYDKTIMAHCVHLSDEDVKLLKDNNVKISHQIVSNLKLAAGIARVPYYMSQGINVSLGTDSVCSNNNIDMFEEMKTAAIIQKTILMDPTVMPAKEVVKMATINGAISQGRENEMGSIELGKDADIILVDIMTTNTMPSFDPYSTIVYSAKGDNVKTTIVKGKVLYNDGKFMTLDFEKAVKELNAYAIPTMYGQK